jgi:hypothetical protein
MKTLRREYNFFLAVDGNAKSSLYKLGHSIVGCILDRVTNYWAAARNISIARSATSQVRSTAAVANGIIMS